MDQVCYVVIIKKFGKFEKKNFSKRTHNLGSVDYILLRLGSHGMGWATIRQFFNLTNANLSGELNHLCHSH